MNDTPQSGWAYTAIELTARNPEAKDALLLRAKPGMTHCTRAKHFPSGRIIYGYRMAQEEAQADAETQARDWDERGS